MGWLIVGAVVATLVVAGAGLVTGDRARAARILFSAAAALLLMKTAWWLAFETPGISVMSRVSVGLVVAGIAAAWWIGAIKWARKP